MTTNGVQLLKNQRMRSVQTGSQYKEKSKSNNGSASIGLDENESIEGILKAESKLSPRRETVSMFLLGSQRGRGIAVLG